MSARPSRPIQEYLTFTRDQVLQAHPAIEVRRWAQDWGDLFRLTTARFPLETVSLVIARWEFLGALYCGITDKQTTFREASSYVRKFLVPLNSAYVDLEELVARESNEERFDFFTMLRNSPLHSYVPAAIATDDMQGVVTWWVGGHGIEPAKHLRIDRKGGLHVDSTRLSSELESSMHCFAAYLEADSDALDGRSPVERWQLGLWARYRPKYYRSAAWMQLAGVHGVPGVR